MKYYFKIAILGILAVVLAGCAETPTTTAVKYANETSNISEPSVTPTWEPYATPPGVYKNADGDLINPTGWEIQEIDPEKTRRYTKTGKTKKGRTVIYSVLSISLANRVASTAIFPEEPYFEWRIRHVDELSGADGKVFCYEYEATLFSRNGNENTAMATATSYRLCDYDGDGKFEFNGDVYPEYIIPNWVKTLPGNPADVNSNANSY